MDVVAVTKCWYQWIHFCSVLVQRSSSTCGTQNRAVFWPFGKRVMELLILDKKERVAESQ